MAKMKTLIYHLLNMVSLANLPDLSVADRTEIEQMRMLVIDAIDDLEQLARARELTSVIWETNGINNKTDRSCQRIEVLLESYERTRDESLESALAKLRKLTEIMNNTVYSNLSSPDIGVNINIGLL